MSLRLVESTFNGNSKLLMSSREIAELTGKMHKHVLVDIRKMLSEIHSAEKPSQYKDSTGRTLPMLMLDKEETLILVSGYNTKLRAAIIRRWQELEEETNKPQFVIPQTYADALRLAADQAEQIALMAPKVEVYDTIVERQHTLTATQVGNKIGLSAVKLNRALGELGVFNSTVKRGRAFRQWFVDEGYGVMRKTPEGYDQALFTNKGEAWIVSKLIKIGLIQSDTKAG